MKALFPSLIVGKAGRRLMLATGVAVLFVMLSGATCPPSTPSLPTPSTNYSTANRLVFPSVPASSITVDGRATETAWSSSFLFEMEHGGGFTAASFRGVADPTHVYLHAKVEDPNFNDADVVVIGLNTNNAAGNYRRIHIYPCKPAGACPDNATHDVSVDYWINGSYGAGGTFSGTVKCSAATGASIPTQCDGIEAKAYFSIIGSNVSTRTWEVEVKIPRSAPFNFVTNNFFGLFLDVVRTDLAAGEAVQYSWPPSQIIGSTEDDPVLVGVDTGTPPPAAWGNATLNDGFGNGVSIYSRDIRTNNPSGGSLIRLNDPNVFYGTATNNSSSGGRLVAANAVKATFKIANFGLPSLGSWANVPAGGNPTAAVNIPPAAANTFETAPWNLTAQQKTDYGAQPHQCVRVELSSTDPNTVFVNATAARNMDFVTTSSPFHARAAVGTRGYEPRRRERALGFTLREKFVNFDPRLPWTSSIRNATRISENVYRVAAAPGADHILDIAVEPPRMTLPRETVRVVPGTGGDARPPVRLEVKPGEIITFIASGTLLIDGQPVTASGSPLIKRQGERRLKHGASRLVGAAMGSFDDFKETVFLISNASTIKVPPGARVLSLKSNDDPEQYAKQQGEGYTFQIVRTAAEPWMVASNPDLARAVRGDDVLVPLGANLPMWLMRGERDTGRVIRIGDKTFRVYESVGSFGYMVKSIN